MKKNVSSQVVSAVVLSATDGSPVTASVAVTVNGDAGTQGAGGGTLAHEGGGEWSYIPTQAETNFDHIMFKFSATGALSVGIQVYTTFPQTGDSFARIGATGSGLTSLASQTSVDDLPTNAELATALAAADDAVLAAIAALNNLSAAAVNAEVDTALADYDGPTNAELEARTLAAASYATATAVDDLPTNAELATALGTADDAVLAAIAALKDFDPATEEVLANVKKINDVTIVGDGSATPFNVA